MHDSQRYRYNAADCLKAAHEAHRSHYRRLYLLMAQSWLSLAHQDDATDDLLATWGMAEPSKELATVGGAKGSLR
jgi:hypothetical protein